MTTPEKLPRNAPESLKARWWRERVAGLHREELADLTGFSVKSIRQFEAGLNDATGKPPGNDAWHRYRLACAAVAAGIEGFAWEPLNED